MQGLKGACLKRALTVSAWPWTAVCLFFWGSWNSDPKGGGARGGTPLQLWKSSLSFRRLFLGREQDCKSNGDMTSSSRRVSVGCKWDTPSKQWRVSSLFCPTAQHLRSSLESVQCKYCHISEWSVPAVCVGDRKWERGQSANHHPAKL